MHVTHRRYDESASIFARHANCPCRATPVAVSYCPMEMPPHPNTSLGANLKQRRKRFGFNQSDIVFSEVRQAHPWVETMSIGVAETDPDLQNGVIHWHMRRRSPRQRHSPVAEPIAKGLLSPVPLMRPCQNIVPPDTNITKRQEQNWWNTWKRGGRGRCCLTIYTHGGKDWRGR